MNSTFITSLANHIKTSYNLQKEELTVVFPNKRAALYLRSTIQKIYNEEIWLPQMLSIQEAMTQWSGMQLIDVVDMLFELISIDSMIYGKNSNIGIFGSMAAQMASDFDEIDQYGVDAKHLFSYVYESKKIGEWNVDGSITPKEEQHLEFFKNLERYYEMLRQRLEQQGKGYYGMITRHLAELDDAQLIECTYHRKIIFAGFNALTPTEQTIINKLFQNGSTEVIWDFDRYYVEDEDNQAGHFARSYIRRNLAWKPVAFSDNLLTQPKQIKLIGVEGNSIQAKALQCLLQVNNEVNTAIVLADENLLVPVLNSIPERYDSLKISMGYPLRQTSFNHLLNAFFILHRKGRKVKQGNWYLWPILRILDLELVQVIFNNKEIDELNKYRSYAAEKSAFIFNDAELKSCCSSPNLLKFFKLLLCDDNDPLELLKGLVALLAFMSDRIQASSQEGNANFLLNQVSEAGKTVNRLSKIVNRHQQYVNTIDDLGVLFHLVSTNTSIKLNSSTAGGLQIMGLLETRNLDFDTFYMVGVNEGVIPADNKSNSFIPYSIRKECGLPDEQEKQAVYAYHFYRLLQGARTAYFIYNANGTNAGGEPSRFLLQLKYELARHNPRVEISQEIFSIPAVANSQPNRIVIHKTDQLMDILMEKIKTKDLKKALAPTSISTYIKCPLLFCFHYLLRIKDNSADENTPANVIGSVVHDTLQRLYNDYRGIAITPELFASDIKLALKSKLQQAIAKQFAHGLPDVGYNYLNQLVIDKMFENWLHYEETDVAHHQLTIIDLEHVLHTNIEVNGINCTIAGTADRIDRHDDIVRVIDYKTGLVKENDVKVPKEVTSVADIPEKAMQLLIYKYLYLKEHPKVNPAMVTASLFVLKQKQVCLDLKVEYEPLNNAFVDTMESLLSQVLSSMMDRSIHFVQPDSGNDKPCHYCEFGDICVSTLAGARLEDGR